QPSRNVAPAAAKLKRHNDWSSSRVAQFPDHLIGVCGLNPLKDYSLEEVARRPEPSMQQSCPNNPAASGARGVTITGVKSRSIRPAPVRQEKESAGEIEPSQQRKPEGVDAHEAEEHDLSLVQQRRAGRGPLLCRHLSE